MFEIRDKIKEGNIVSYCNKQYIIIRKDIIMGGNCMLVEMIKFTPDKTSSFKFIKTLYDEQIEKLKIL